MMPEAIEFLTNPDFHKLPLGDRLEVLRKDSNFAALNPKDQGEIITKAQRKVTPGSGLDVEKPKDAGFFSTLGSDISNIPAGIKQAVTHPIDTLKSDKGTRDSLNTQANQDYKGGQYIPAIAENLASYIPFVGPQAAQAGNELGAGQFGQGSAHALEAVAPFAARGLPGASRVGSALKVAAPDLAKGAIKTGAGIGVGAAAGAMGAPGYMEYMLGSGPAKAGLRQMGEGLVKGAKELVNRGEAPQAKIGDVDPPKGPSIGQLKTAAKSGTITPEQFDASIDKMTDLDPEAKSLHKAELRTSLAPKNPIKSPVNAPKTLSLGDLKSLVKVGRLSSDEFKERLSSLGYNEEDANHLTELLKKQIEDDKDEEGEEGKLPKNPVTPKEPKTPGIGQVKTPGHESFLETEAPYKPPITEHQIEESQSTARKAKETALARHFADKEKFPELPKREEVTSDYLKAVGDEAGLKRVPSLRTFENAIRIANELRGSERGSFSLKDLKVEKPDVIKLMNLFKESDLPNPLGETQAPKLDPIQNIIENLKSKPTDLPVSGEGGFIQRGYKPHYEGASKSAKDILTESRKKQNPLPR